MGHAFLFPGQGSQFVGMGKDLHDTFPEARATFEEVDDALGEKLSTLIFEGPEDKLNLTENTQPSLMAVSMAIIHVLSRREGIRIETVCDYMAGHSLGEYSALTATGALELSDTAKLLEVRGQAMQQAVPVGEGAMVAVLGLDLQDVDNIAETATRETKHQTCEIANDNSNGQVVISGHAEAVKKAAQLAEEQKAKRVVELPVSAPFHSALMTPAAQEMAQALADTNIRPPFVPVVSNVTAEAVSEPADIRRLLVDQITHRVRWRESVLWMKDNGIDSVTEIGAGKVLAGLVRRIDRDMDVASVGTVDQVETLIEQLQTT